MNTQLIEGHGNEAQRRIDRKAMKESRIREERDRLQMSDALSRTGQMDAEEQDAYLRAQMQEEPPV